MQASTVAYTSSVTSQASGSHWPARRRASCRRWWVKPMKASISKPMARWAQSSPNNQSREVPELSSNSNLKANTRVDSALSPPQQRGQDPHAGQVDLAGLGGHLIVLAGPLAKLEPQGWPVKR